MVTKWDKYLPASSIETKWDKYLPVGAVATMPIPTTPVGITVDRKKEAKAMPIEPVVKPRIAEPFPEVPLAATRTTPLAPGFQYDFDLPTTEVIPLKDTASILGESLQKLPTQIGASVLQAVQGEQGASVVNRDWQDRYIASAKEDINAFVEGVSQQYPGTRVLPELAQLPQNLAYSLTAMGPGVVASLPLWLAPEPTTATKIAASAVTGAVSGFVSYRMTTYQITQEYLEFKDAGMRAQSGRGITQEEENQLKADFHDKAVKYGLWEAVPEGISNMLFSGILGGSFNSVLAKVVGQKAAQSIASSLGVKVATKLGSIYGEELLTETITQKGQAAVEVEAGLREGNITWAEAFKEIAPQTMLLTTIMAGAGQTIISSTNAIKRLKNSLQNEIGKDHSMYEIIEEGIESYWGELSTTTTAMAEGATTLPTAEFNPITTPVGKGYEITQYGNPVGEISYMTEFPGVDGIVIDRIDIAPEARRQGLATQAINKVLIEAEQAGVPLYTGLLEADGVQLITSLEQRGIINLTPAPQRMLGEQITRTLEFTPTSFNMAEWGTPEAPITPKTLPWAINEYKNQLARKEAELARTRLFSPQEISQIKAAEGRIEFLQDTISDLEAQTTAMAEGEAFTGGFEGEVEVTGLEDEYLAIPEELPTAPPPLTPVGQAMGRTDNNWEGFLKDLQDANTLEDVAFRQDVLRKVVPRIPILRNLFGVIAPNVLVNTPAGKYTVIKAHLVDEGGQKSQGVIAHLQEVGKQKDIFGAETAEHAIKSGPLKGYSVGFIAEHRGRFEAKLTPEQKLWLDRANLVEQGITEYLIRSGIDINKVSIEEGGQFATRRVYGKKLDDGTMVEVGFVGAAPGRPGAKLATEKHRQFKDEAEANKNGYYYIPYEEALYLRLAGAYRRIADKQAAEWLLTQVEWRTTAAPEELVLAAESARLKQRHSQMLLAALNRAVRGERVPDSTFHAIGMSYPEQALQVMDLIPDLQAGKPVARKVQQLTRTANGLISTNKLMQAKAVSQRARAREAAMTKKVGEAEIAAPAFKGKILTGPDAKETMQTVSDTFRPQFSKVLGEINKFNAVVRYFMLAGDISYPSIQLIFMMGENPKAFAGAMRGAVHSIFSPKFHDAQIAQHKDVIDRHPNMMLSIRGRTEMTEAMAKGGWLSGESHLFPQGERYMKSLGLLVPRAAGKVGGKLLTPFQRGMESALDLAGIYLALANEHMATTPEQLADLDQWINEFRGLTSSSRIGVTTLERQRERGAILAPQYNRAIAGWLWSLTRGGLRGHLARRSLARGMVPIVAMAVAISLLRGEDKDEIIEHLNPNSPNFFTWDIAGQKVGPGSKVRSLLKLFAQSAENPDDLMEFSMDNPALRFMRGNASPAVSTGIDLLTGKSYIGDPTRDGMLSFSKEVLAGNLLPIWVQSTLLEGGNTGGRSVRGLAEFFGWRAYPESLWDEVGRLKDRYAQQDFRTAWEDLNREQTDTVRANHPDLTELEERARVEQAERGNEFEHAFYVIREEAVKERNDALENAATLLLGGTLTKYDYDKERGYARPYYSGGMAALYGLRDRLDPKAIKDIQEWLNENQKPEDKALDAYQEYRANLINDAELPRDWDEIEALGDQFLSKYSKNTQDYVRRNLNRWINDLPENAKQIELARLAGIENETWWDDYRGTGGAGTRWDKYTSTPGTGGTKWDKYLQ